MSKKDNGEGLSIIKSLSIGDTKIDASNPDNWSKKIVSERETRGAMLKQARKLGCEREMLILFAKYDNLLRNCTSEEERKGISQLGAYEVGKLLGYEEFIVDGIPVITK